MIPTEVKRIIEVVERDRGRKVGEIRKANVLEVKKILKSGEEECKSLKEKILEDYKRRAEVLRRKGLADIEIKRRETLKGLKSEMVKNLKEEVVREIRKNNYEKFLTGFLERGIKEIGKGDLKVFVNTGDIDCVKNFLRRKGVKGEVKGIKTSGGCMVKSGKITANYLIESLLERKGKEMDKVINDMFFKG
ncbi:MAG: hypothetical protein GTN38_00440 [Candidatus Aenigmarchaeota archaeon]|nr:hypothetical protein [Candidatus Aenigmarchaeota archaeon]NIQ17691.1 hypothetical protein [Candidatus Aenigmarchaeota archaeon]NIS72879.1 hypothetical protein [Candidatus Aenigmarchaeota archaeon]